jgi:hypothetical protein
MSSSPRLVPQDQQIAVVRAAGILAGDEGRFARAGQAVRSFDDGGVVEEVVVAGILAEQLRRAALVRGDVFRRMAASGREELLPDETTEARAQLDLRYRLSALVADEYAHHGWTAVVQDIILGDDLTRYVARVHTRPLYVVVPAPSISVVRAREAARPKAGYGVWTVEALDHALRAETPRLGP